MSSSMRIAVVHSYYISRVPSGENIVVDTKVGALREAGHDVPLVDQIEAGPSQVYVEAMAAGLPTLSIEGDGTSDEITEHQLGLVIIRKPDSSTIVGALAKMRCSRVSLSQRCADSYSARFDRETWLHAAAAMYICAKRGSKR